VCKSVAVLFSGGFQGDMIVDLMNLSYSSERYKFSTAYWDFPSDMYHVTCLVWKGYRNGADGTILRRIAIGLTQLNT
jgi:hypothetical protein